MINRHVFPIISGRSIVEQVVGYDSSRRNVRRRAWRSAIKVQGCTRDKCPDVRSRTSSTSSIAVELKDFLQMWLAPTSATTSLGKMETSHCELGPGRGSGQEECCALSWWVIPNTLAILASPAGSLGGRRKGLLSSFDLGPAWIPGLPLTNSLETAEGKRQEHGLRTSTPHQK